MADGRPLALLAVAGLAGVGIARVVYGARGIVRRGRMVTSAPTHDQVVARIGASARYHGEVSEPDHETGDLLDALRITLTKFVPPSAFEGLIEQINDQETLLPEEKWPKETRRRGQALSDEIRRRIEAREGEEEGSIRPDLAADALAMAMGCVEEERLPELMTAYGADVGWQGEEQE